MTLEITILSGMLFLAFIWHSAKLVESAIDELEKTELEIHDEKN